MKFFRNLFLGFGIALISTCAWAQSTPNLSYGDVPTAAQWNSFFAAKQDTLGYIPLNSSGGAMTGELTTAASATNSSGFNLPQGLAPTSPVNGDLWTTSSGLFIRVAGTTLGPLGTAACPSCVTTNVTNTFTAYQIINLNATSVPTVATGSVLQLTQADTTVGRVEMDTFGAAAVFTGFRADGTNASPTGLVVDDEIVAVNAWGYDATARSTSASASMRAYAGGTWSNTSHPTYVDFSTTAIASITLTSRMRVENDGGITVGGTASQGAGTLNLLNGLFNNGVAPTGTGGYVRATAPTVSSLTVTGAFNAAGLVTNSDLANSGMVLNGLGVTLGGTFTLTSAAGTLTGSTLNSSVISSSLTGVGTLTGGSTGSGFTIALTTSTISGNLPIGNLPSIAANSLLMNNTGSGATPVAVAVGTCTNALTYSSGAFGCNATAGTGTLTQINQGVNTTANPGSGVSLSTNPCTTTCTVSIDPTFIRDYIAGCVLSTAGASTTFGIAPCVSTDSANAYLMKQVAAYTKTTSAWAVGSGSGSLDTGTIAGITWYHAFEIIRTDTGVVDYLTSQAPGTNSVVTITIASPGVIAWTNHGLQANAPVILSTTGALPTGLTAGTQYFVKSVVDVGHFTVSASIGGTVIATTGSQSGTQTATSNPILPASYTGFRRIGSLLTDVSAHWVQFTQFANEFHWAANVVDIPFSAGNITNTSAFVPTLTVPPSVAVNALFHVGFAAPSGGASGLLITSMDENDIAPDSIGGNANASLFATTSAFTVGDFNKRTNTSAQIRYRASFTGSDIGIYTYGWIDTRGSNN